MLTTDLNIEEKYKTILLEKKYDTAIKVVFGLHKIANLRDIGEKGAARISAALREIGIRSELLPEELFLAVALTSDDALRDQILRRFSETPITDEQSAELYRALRNSEEVSERDMMCLRLHFGLGCMQMSFGQIGRIYGISRQRVQEICRAAIIDFRTEYAGRAEELFFMSRSDLLKELTLARRELHGYQRQFYPGNLPIERLELSMRAYNCLKHAGINTLDEARRANLDSLSGIGTKTLREILEKIYARTH